MLLLANIQLVTLSKTEKVLQKICLRDSLLYYTPHWVHAMTTEKYYNSHFCLIETFSKERQ